MDLLGQILQDEDLIPTLLLILPISRHLLMQSFDLGLELLIDPLHDKNDLLVTLLLAFVFLLNLLDLLTVIFPIKLGSHTLNF